MVILFFIWSHSSMYERIPYTPVKSMPPWIRWYCVCYIRHIKYICFWNFLKKVRFVNLLCNSNQLATNFKCLKNSQRYFRSFSLFCRNLSRRTYFFVTLADYQSTLIQHIRRLQIAIYSFSFKQNKPRFILTLYA